MTPGFYFISSDANPILYSAEGNFASDEHSDFAIITFHFKKNNYSVTFEGIPLHYLDGYPDHYDDTPSFLHLFHELKQKFPDSLIEHKRDHRLF